MTALLPTNWLRAAYLRWRLANVEADIETYSKTVKLWRGEAESLRVQLADLEAL